MAIHASAFIDPRADVHPTASIGPHVMIDGPVTIGAGCQIGPSAVILGHTEIGAGCRIHAHAVIGDLPQDRAYTGGTTFCRIGSECSIREGVTIHRGTALGSATVIGNRCLLMTNSHVGHNCELADDVTLVSGALLGGHVKVGARAIISGNAAIHQFVRIGELALVGILARVTQDIPPFVITNQEGEVAGVNAVGLRRAKLTSAEKEELKTAFRLIQQCRIGRDVAVDYLKQIVSTDAGRRLLEFFEEGSRRGITTRAPRRREAA